MLIINQGRMLRYSLTWKKYFYANGNDVISFNIKNDRTKATLTHMYTELVISKPTTTSV